MARSSANDPLEKFRFQVTLLDNMAGLITQNVVSIGSKQSDAFVRGGFSEATTPRVSIKEMTYRETNMGNSPIKVPGLASYEPVVLRRGVTTDQSMYNWYKQVNDESGTLNKFQSGIVALGAVPFQDPGYRKEVLISALDRKGQFTKHWLLYNAWPSGYKGMNDFDAKVSEIGVEELVLSYEIALEVRGDSIQAALNEVTAQAVAATQKAGIAGAIGGAAGFINNLF